MTILVFTHYIYLGNTCLLLFSGRYMSDWGELLSSIPNEKYTYIYYALLWPPYKDIKYKLQGSERSNCMENTLKIRVFTIHTLHYYIVVTTTHNKYLCIFHWGYQKGAHLSQTYIDLKTIKNKYSPSRYIE